MNPPSASPRASVDQFRLTNYLVKVYGAPDVGTLLISKPSPTREKSCASERCIAVRGDPFDHKGCQRSWSPVRTEEGVFNRSIALTGEDC